MPWIHGDWVEDYPGEANSEAGGWAFDPYVRQLFERAGWKPRPRTALVVAGNAMAYATVLLEEFGGLHVGESGEGIECGAGNIDFLRAPEPVHPHWVARWPRLSAAVVIGEAHDTYADVIVDVHGDFLVYTGVDERLYNFGSDFARFTEIVLRGLAWPRDIEGGR